MHEKKYPLLTDPRDTRFLTLRFLRTPQGRSRTELYLIEGIRHVAQAVEQKAPLQSVFYDPSVLSNRFGRKLVDRLRRRGMPGVRLSPQLYRQLTLAAEPQGLGAVMRQEWTRMEGLSITRNSLLLGIEAIESAGNLGTIIRTADAAGVAGIFLIGTDTDPWDPATVRASMGSLFSQKFIQCTAREFRDWSKARGVTVVGSSPKGLLSYRDFRCRWPVALLLGSEKEGLSDHLKEACDFMVRIPMVGRCDSVNVAVAAGILLFEMSHQVSRTRRPSPG